MILVTGGAGFIGSNFVLDWLATRDEPLVTLDKLTYAGHLENLADIDGNPRHIFVRGDIGDGRLVTQLLRTHPIRAVINFAAESHVDRSLDGPSDFIDTNIVGTYRLLEAVRDHWATLPTAEQAVFRFLHVSTDEVYGSLAPAEAPFTERHPHRPNSPYSASKAASDHLVRAWYHSFGLPVITTNCSNNYGPRHHPEKLIPLIIVNALADRPLPVYGDGQQVRDWLYVGDHVQALQRVLDAGRIGETYNIGGANERTNLTVVHTACDLLDELRPRRDGRSYRTLIHHVADRPGHDRRYAINACKIADELGWRPTESFETGLRKTVEWFLSNRAWVEAVTKPAPTDRQVAK